VNPFPPAGAPRFALHNSAELRGYTDIPGDGPISGEKARELVRAYYACVSYMDAQVGRLLGALDELGLTESTTVVLVGDHGYHLGEHGLWNKHTNFETAVRTPLIVRVPDGKAKGRKTAALTELTDIYPSLCALSNLPIPDGLEGSTFSPLFEDPDRIWKRAVFSQYPREIPGIGPAMGYSMRTNRFRYTEWRAPGTPYKSAELYDYVEDPQEMANLAVRPENASLVNGLAGMLQEGWRSAFPPTDPRSGSS
jgi:arylsulfatase A-like enzyme